MFETTFKNIDDILFKDAGCNSELDYSEGNTYKSMGAENTGFNQIGIELSPGVSELKGQ